MPVKKVLLLNILVIADSTDSTGDAVRRKHNTGCSLGGPGGSGCGIYGTLVLHPTRREMDLPETSD